MSGNRSAYISSSLWDVVYGNSIIETGYFTIIKCFVKWKSADLSYYAAKAANCLNLTKMSYGNSATYK